ncbi:MAG: family 16 glycoside hydrolase [Candidatus Poribacteria bacterium]
MMKKICVVSFVTFMFLTSFAFAGKVTEDFTKDLDKTWKVFAGVWKVQKGVLNQSEMGGPKVIVWETLGELKNFTITVEARQLTADADWGLAFRASDIANHYSWQWVNGHLAFVTYITNARTEAWTQNQPQEQNVWQEYKVVSKDTSYDLYWKGNKINTFEHKSLTKGFVGFFVWDQVDFDNFVVESDEIKGGMAVSPQVKLATTWGELKYK